MVDKVFVFRMNAIAGEHAQYESGARHAHLVFARGASLERAEASAVTALEDHGWGAVEVSRGGEVKAGVYEAQDEVIQSAAKHAAAAGTAIITYGTPG